MKFKDSERHKKEFWELHPLLQLILMDLNDWAITRGEEMTVTELIRTDAEQETLFKDGDAKERISVHQFGRGADVRLFKKDPLNLLVGEYINHKYPYGDGVHKTLVTHEGTAMHHHLQVKE